MNAPAPLAVPAVRARGLSLTHRGGTAALAGVDLEVATGSHTVIIGPSGAGKSSLLALLSGRLAPTAGSVEVAGRVATIHQDLRLVGRSSALVNVLHGALGRLSFARSLAWPRAERERAAALLHRVGLGHRLHAPVRNLSGGEAQRVAIARALMTDPRVLLADEPVASLDPANAESVMALLDELRRERGLTLVTVLHDRALGSRWADRVVELEAGRVVAEGDHTTSRVSRPAVAVPAPAAHPVERPSSLPGLALAAVAILALWGSWGVLDLDAIRAEGAVSAALAFLGNLVPSAAELATVDWRALGLSLLDTLRMAVLGTVGGVVLALPLSVLAARNLMPHLLAAPVRGVLNLWRAVPSIVWALLFVAAAGLGPAAGVLGLVAYSLGYLTKFFYEAFEGADAAAPAALAGLGAGPLQCFVHAVWPLSLPALTGAGLFMLEYNVRAASVLGLVGAGGLGQDLKLAVDWANWHLVGVILVLLAVAVVAVDWLSALARRAVR